MDTVRYSKSYSKALKYMAVGKQGTPEWNPTPHPEADPAVVAARASDPLWMAQRGLYQDEDGSLALGISPAAVVRTGMLNPSSPTYDPNYHPVGFVPYGEAISRADTSTDADVVLTRRGSGHLDSRHPENYNNAHHYLLPYTGRSHRLAQAALDSLITEAAPHDPYRLLAASARSGNRHALPELVNLLQKRDNPSGWYPGWAALAKVMQERVGDLLPHDVWRRANAIAHATVQHSQNPEEHRQLATEASAASDPLHNTQGPNWTPYLALADHMQENGLPQYSQLLKAELANVIPSLRKQPRRKGSRL